MPEPSTCTVPTHALLRFLADLSLTASQDRSVPMLCGIAIHTDKLPADGVPSGPVMIGTSTDRYSLGQLTVPVVGALSRPVFLPLHTVKQIQQVVRPYAAKSFGGTEVVLTATESGLTLDLDVLDGRVSLTVPTPVDQSGEFVLVREILGKAIEAEPSADPMVLDPALMDRFVKVAASRRPEPMRVSSTGANRPLLIRCGTDYVGILMTMRGQAVPAAVAHEFPPAAAAAAKREAQRAARAAQLAADEEQASKATAAATPARARRKKATAAA